MPTSVLITYFAHWSLCSKQLAAVDVQLVTFWGQHKSFSSWLTSEATFNRGLDNIQLRRELSRKIFVCFIYVWVSGVCLLTILHNIFYSWTAATCFLLYIHLTSIEIKYERLNDQAIFLLCMEWIITCLPLFRFSLR